MGRKSRGESSSTYIRTWQDAEYLAARAMRQWGYADARASPGGADRGIDVRATGALGQVKHHAARVGRPDIQRFIGATFDHPRAQLFFFSAGGYSSAAIEEATRRGIALFIYSVEGTMSTVNPPAREIIQVERKRSRSSKSRSPKPTAWERVTDVNSRLEDWRRNHTETDQPNAVTAAMPGGGQHSDSVLQQMRNWRDNQRSERQKRNDQETRHMAFIGRSWRWLLGCFLLSVSLVNLFDGARVASPATDDFGALIAVGITGLLLVAWHIRRRRRR